MKSIVYYFLILLFTGSILQAQKVTVSNEINVRSNYSYDILPNIDDHILFYHDKGFEHSFEIYDQNLRYKRTKQLSLEKRNVAVLGVVPADTSFNFYYAYKEEGMAFIRVNKLDKYGEIKEAYFKTKDDLEELRKETGLMNFENLKKLISGISHEHKEYYILVHYDNYYKTMPGKSFYDKIWETPELEEIPEYRDYLEIR